MKKNIFALSLALVLAFGLLAGCSENNGQSSATPPAEMTSPANDGTSPDGSTIQPSDIPASPSPTPSKAPFVFPDVQGYTKQVTGDSVVYGNDTDTAVINILTCAASEEDLSSLETGLTDTMRQELSGLVGGAALSDPQVIDMPKLSCKALQAEVDNSSSGDGENAIYSRLLAIPAKGKATYMLVYAVVFASNKDDLMVAYDKVVMDTEWNPA